MDCGLDVWRRSVPQFEERQLGRLHAERRELLANYLLTNHVDLIPPSSPRSVRSQFDDCPISMQFKQSSAVDGPQQTGATGIVERPLGRTTEQSHRVPA